MLQRSAKVKPNIYEFLDYRRFLKAMYEHFKFTKPSFSYRNFARAAGLKASNHLKLVMDGKRNLSPQAIYQFAKAFWLKNSEQDFFALLVHFDQAKTTEEKSHYYEKIAAQKSYHQVRPLEIGQYEYLSRWHWVALHELVKVKGFREDPKWINQKLGLKLDVKEIEKAIYTLLELGLLKRTSKGELIQSESRLTTQTEVFSLAAINFHRQMMKKASESIDTSRTQDRDLSSLTISVNRKQFERIRERLAQLRREIHAMVETEEPKDAVYQMNLHLFNLSKVPWS